MIQSCVYVEIKLGTNARKRGIPRFYEERRSEADMRPFIN
jgi:hypothetical protein